MLYVATGLYVNYFLLQVFCVPVQWAAIYSCIALFAILIAPFIKHKFLTNILYVILGASVPVCLYCILFIADPWAYCTGYILPTVAILFFGIGLIAYIPVYLLWHIIQYYQQASKVQKALFYIGLVMPFLFLSTYLSDFRKDYNALAKAYATNTVSQIQPTTITEQLLGIGYKYHTKIEYIYDGWRPPIHHPFLNIGLWLYGESYFPFQRLAYPFTGLDRPKYYTLLFPHRSLKADCVCSFMKDALTYRDERTDFKQDSYFTE